MLQTKSVVPDDVLRYAVAHGMIDLSYVQEQIEMNKRKELLEKHPHKIWEGKDGKWYTYIHYELGERALKKRGTKDEIETLVIQYYQEQEQHPCFREVYAKWILEKEEFCEVGENTITRYDNDFERFFPKSEPFCKIRLCDMTDSELERFIKKTIKEKGLTYKSYAMLRLIINGVFKFAKREGYTNYSISTFFKDLSLPSNIFKKRVKNPEMEVFNEVESRKVLEYCLDNPTLENLGIAVNFYSGLRVGELSALKHSDINIGNYVNVHRTEIVYKDKRLGKRVTVVKEYPKTDAGDRKVIIPDEAWNIMRMIISRNPTGEYLFMRNGKRITERMFNYYLKAACKNVGIAPRSTHKVRKTYGSKLLQNNVDSAIVLKQIGHKNISTTHGYYHYDITTDGTRKKLINGAIVY